MDEPKSREPPPLPPDETELRGLELDTPDDPKAALWEALARGDPGRALGAWRLLQAAGQQPELDPTLALELGDLLERGGAFLDAARAFRLAAEAQPDGPEAPKALLRAARLLLGPADRPAIGVQILRLLLARVPGFEGREQAADWLARIESGGSLSGEELGLGAEAAPLSRPAFEVVRQVAAAAARPETVAAQVIQRLTGRVGSRRWRRLARALQVCAALFALGWFVPWWFFDDFYTDDPINPEALRDPLQTAVANPTSHEFERDGYRYRVIPLFDYDVAGLVVALRDHTSFWRAVSSYDQTFPLDVCLIWGDNLNRGLQHETGMVFDIQGRVCYGQGRCGIGLREDQLGNNHIFAAEGELADTLAGLRPGDQVRVVGQLVEIHATRLGADRGNDPARLDWRSSTSRTDKGLGACETILPKSVEVLSRAHAGPRLVGRLSGWVLVALGLLAALRFLLLPVRVREVARGAEEPQQQA